MKTTEELRNEVLAIRDDLRAGRITNPVARSLLHAAKIALDSLRLEIDASKLGAGFSTVLLNQEDREKEVKSRVRRVA